MYSFADDLADVEVLIGLDLTMANPGDYSWSDHCMCASYTGIS